MLFSAEDCVRFRHRLFDRLVPEIFLSKLCESTFAGYALTQVRKARGLNKKIVNPMAEERKQPLDFCYVLEAQGSTPLVDWLRARSVAIDACGIVNVPHMHDVYGIYHDAARTAGYRGIFKDDDATELRFSSVPIEAEPIGWMGYNRDGFKKYCKEYREYWDWVKDRNEARYATTIDHGRNYDSKNMMHTFRLLDIAAEIARAGTITLRSANREFLLKIKAGEFAYDDLIKMVEERVASISELYAASTLPDEPDRERIESVLVEIRSEFYSKG
jgi:hypothetical protein